MANISNYDTLLFLLESGISVVLLNVSRIPSASIALADSDADFPAVVVRIPSTTRLIDDHLFLSPFFLADCQF